MREEINLLTIEEVANKLRISERTVYRYMKASELKAIKLTRGVTRIDEKDLIQFLKKHKIK